MILNGASKDDRMRIENTVYDICIVGAGAVGILMADRLRLSGKKIVVIDSGIENQKEQDKHFWERRYHDPIAETFDHASFAETSWGKQRPDFFLKSRTRGFGGSTNCWGGWIRPLDSHDFSRWPVNIERDLKKWYPTVMEYLGLEKDSWRRFDDPEWWIKNGKVGETIGVFDARHLRAAGLRTAIIQQQGNLSIIGFIEQFSELFKDDGSDLLTLVKNATATELKTWSSDGMNHFTSSDGKTKYTSGPLICRYALSASSAGEELIEVKAKQYVLAMGGLEIPRFLLNCIPDSVGLNELKDKGLGLYYMSHPKYQIAAKCSLSGEHQPPQEVRRFYTESVKLLERPTVGIQAFVVPTADLIRKKGINNFRNAISFGLENDGQVPVDIEIDIEQQANAGSIISADPDPNNKDIFGNPQLKLDWRFTEKDARTLNESLNSVRTLLSGYGLVGSTWNDSFSRWDFAKTEHPPYVSWNEPYTSDHHIGTCRMGKRDEGVVDKDLKVTGFNNLWICSTAIYPTGGWANATFVLLSLALRLASNLALR
ncbi:MAG: hypothetical protein C0469_18285 [Cyanobacteria bacterium DS2.3.42]|nr:hypothetical protein [Cyanobacteria bacterium DS2.3.42]